LVLDYAHNPDSQMSVSVLVRSTWTGSSTENEWLLHSAGKEPADGKDASLQVPGSLDAERVSSKLWNYGFRSFVLYSIPGCRRFCSGLASKLHHISIEINKASATGATTIT
jgi:hypothetical protein